VTPSRPAGWLGTPPGAVWPGPDTPHGDDPNPFVRFRHLLWAHHAALSTGLDDGAYVDLVRRLDEAVAGYALAARHRPMSAAYLQRTLSDYFRVPVKIDQFVGKWYDVPPDQLSVLGEVNAVLGGTALVGERVWQRDMRARLVGAAESDDLRALARRYGQAGAGGDGEVNGIVIVGDIIGAVIIYHHPVTRIL